MKSTTSTANGSTHVFTRKGTHLRATGRKATSGTPTLETDQAILHSHIEDTLDKIIMPAGGLLPKPYIIPSAPAPGASADRQTGNYVQTYDWDMFFEGIRLNVAGKPERLRDNVLNFLAQTDESGYTPRTLTPDRYFDFPDQCKPFLVQGAYLSSKALGDFQWLKGEPLRKLGLTLRYWETQRRGPDGLYLWDNGIECGADNAVPLVITPPRVVEGVDLNCYLVREYKALAEIEHSLGLHEDASVSEGKANRLAGIINDRMWDPKDHIYYSIDSRTGERIKVKDWTAFLPLWAGIARPDQAKQLIEEHLLNPKEFWGDHGIASLAKSEEVYNNARRSIVRGWNENRTISNWQGPVWVLPNYLAMHGALNYGYQKAAREIAERVVRTVAADIRTSGGMHENYDFETGKALWAPNFGSWDLLADQMLEEAKTGFNPTRIG